MVVVSLWWLGCAAPSGVEGNRDARATVDGTRHHVLAAREIDQVFSIDVWQPIGAPGPHPVVYVTDGNMLFATVAQIVGPMMHAGTIPPVVVVGIGYEGVSPLDVAMLRTRDFLPTDVEGFGAQMAAAGFPLPDGVRPGGADAFLAFIEDEVKPFVAARYDVDESNETLVGLSYGGTFASHVLLSRTDAFERYVIGSPALAWDDGVLFRDEDSRARSGAPMPATVFVSAGSLEVDNGILDVTRRMVEVLGTRDYEGLTLRAHVFEEETHESVLGVSISRGLRAVFGTWAPTTKAVFGS